MAPPPAYGDLGKQARDLHSKGFHPGLVKFEAKTKTKSGVKFSTTGQRGFESGKVLAGCEATFAWPDYGLKYVEKWSTDNQLSVDVSVEDKLIKGMKTSFISSFQPSTHKKKGTVKTAYKHDYASAHVDVDFDYAGPVINASLVGGYNNFLLGYQMGVNGCKKSITANNFSLVYDGGKHIANVTVKNGQDFGGSYFHKVNPNLEMGVLADFLSASKGSCPYQGSIAAKYAASPDTALKAKVAVSGEVGLSVQQKISNTISLTLSTLFDFKNLSGGGHQVGMSVEFEQ